MGNIKELHIQLKGMEAKLQLAGVSSPDVMGSHLLRIPVLPMDSRVSSMASAGRNFEDLLCELAVTSQATDTELDTMRALAIELGKTSLCSTSGVLEDMIYMAAKYNPKEIIASKTRDLRVHGKAVD